jgi:hypothetical protein
MRTTILGAAALSAALTLSLQTTAGADSIGVEDPADLGHGADLRSVVVEHKARNVVVTTTHTNLRPSWRSGSSGSVFIDTDPSNPGPEFVFVGGYFDGTDYTLVHAEGWHHRSWGEPVDGSYRMRLDYDREHVRMRISREALGSPEEVRVAVKVAGTRRDGSNTKRDWLGEPRSWTEWVTQ